MFRPSLLCARAPVIKVKQLLTNCSLGVPVHSKECMLESLHTYLLLVLEIFGLLLPLQLLVPWEQGHPDLVE